MENNQAPQVGGRYQRAALIGTGTDALPVTGRAGLDAGLQAARREINYAEKLSLLTVRRTEVIATVQVMAGLHTPLNVVILSLHRRNMLRALHVSLYD